MTESKKVVFTTKKVEEIAKKLDEGYQIKRVDNPFWESKIGIRRDGITFAFTQAELDEYTKCKLDIAYFANNHCKVKTEDGTYKVINLRDYQHDIINMFEKNQFNILLASRQIGKTICSSIFLLHYMLFNNDKNVLIAANIKDTAKEVMDKIKAIYMGLPFFLQKGVVVWNQGTLKFDNGTRAKGFAMSPTASIGQSADCVYVDEFAYINNNIAESFYKSIQPTLVSIENSKMIITSTPNGLNLFHKLLTDSERDDKDPLKNKFASMRTYWHQVPGRNVSYIRCNPFKMEDLGLNFDEVYKEVLNKYNPNGETDANGLTIVSRKKSKEVIGHEIHIQNVNIATEDLYELTFFNDMNEEIPVTHFAEISSWKIDAIKNIGGQEAFNQEYDLRFMNASKSLFTENILKRISDSTIDFEYSPHEVFDNLHWNYDQLTFINDNSIFNEENRKDYTILMSVDVSEGLGQDYSVINIFKVSKKSNELIEENITEYEKFSDLCCLEQIGLFRSNIVSVGQLSELLYLLSFKYFDEEKTRIVLERNNHGHAVLEAIPKVFNSENDYGSNIFFRFFHRKDDKKKKIGLKVHAGNKNIMVRDYKDKITSRDIIIHNLETVSEIGTFIKNETTSGRISYQADGSCKDDIVMTIVNLTSVFKENLFHDFIEEFIERENDTQLNNYMKMIEEDYDTTENIDYGSFLKTKNRAVASNNLRNNNNNNNNNRSSNSNG